MAPAAVETNMTSPTSPTSSSSPTMPYRVALLSPVGVAVILGSMIVAGGLGHFMGGLFSSAGAVSYDPTTLTRVELGEFNVPLASKSIGIASSDRLRFTVSAALNPQIDDLKAAKMALDSQQVALRDRIQDVLDGKTAATFRRPDVREILKGDFLVALNERMKGGSKGPDAFIAVYIILLDRPARS